MAAQTAGPAPDPSVMNKLISDLKVELKAISDAQEALAKYITQRFN